MPAQSAKPHLFRAMMSWMEACRLTPVLCFRAQADAPMDMLSLAALTELRVDGTGLRAVRTDGSHVRIPMHQWHSIQAMENGIGIELGFAETAVPGSGGMLAAVPMDTPGWFLPQLEERGPGYHLRLATIDGSIVDDGTRGAGGH